MNCDKNQQNERTIRWQIVEFHCRFVRSLFNVALTKAGWRETRCFLLYEFSVNGKKIHMQITICLIS
jgi:hypothetical protein